MGHPHDFSEDPHAHGSGSAGTSSATVVLIILVASAAALMLMCGGIILGGVFIYRATQQEMQVAIEEAAAAGGAYQDFGSLSQQGRYREALEVLDQALVQWPDNPYLLNNKAWLLATCPVAEFRDGEHAIELATRACEIESWSHAAYLDTLAAAYAETGDYESAVKWQREAITHNRTNIHGLPEDFQARLDLYQSGQPYREGVVPDGYVEAATAEHAASDHTDNESESFEGAMPEETAPLFDTPGTPTQTHP